MGLWGHGWPSSQTEGSDLRDQSLRVNLDRLVRHIPGMPPALAPLIGTGLIPFWRGAGRRRDLRHEAAVNYRSGGTDRYDGLSRTNAGMRPWCGRGSVAMDFHLAVRQIPGCAGSSGSPAWR